VFLDWVAGCEESEATEHRRISRIQCGFAVLGLAFGSIYAVFYGLLGFGAGMAVILFCTSLMGAGLLMLRAGWSLPWVGNWLTGILVAGFSTLIYCEGGVSAHAAAWLGSTPLCALMLVGSVRAGAAWGGVAVLVIFLYFLLEMMGVHFDPLYHERWHTLVTGLGFMGLGPFLLLIALTFEVTRSRAVEAREAALRDLAQANDRLTKLNEEKDHFLGIAAHDLRNPLGLIDGFAQILEMDPSLNDASKQNLGRIRDSSKRMASIIDDLLDLNKIEQGNFALNVNDHDLLVSAKDAVASVRMDADRKSIVIQVEADDPPYVGRVDQRALEQVLTNLLSNAVKYSKPNTIVTVACVAGEHWTTVEIIDQGPGFSAEDRKKMYQRFAKLSARPTGGETSTGLGLSIVRRMTEAMAGQIECRPGPHGIGTRFRVSFPAGAPARSEVKG